MKKFLTLLWLTITAFTFKATAQPGTTCNAEFSIQYLTNYTVKFNPVIATDSPHIYHYWSFGDASAISQQISPTHTYTLPGVYSAVHTIVRTTPNNVPVCTQSFTRLVTITAACNLVANFSWTATQTNPLRIEFHNLSIPLSNTDSIRWTFGDGSSSPDVNPVHTYNVPGTYTVCLRVKKNGNVGSTVPCVREICKTVVVTQPCNLVVNFSAQPDPNHALRIKFTNLSTPLSPTDSIHWTFGDGSSVNGLQSNPNVANPTHNYSNAGFYLVCLRVKKNNNGTTASCVRDKCDSIIVHHPCNFDVNFRWRLDSINPRKIYFTNLSTPPTATATAIWTFGDGSSATSWNAIHEYAHPGSYIVCLRIYLGPNSNCVREKCDTIFIPNPPPPCTQLSKYRFEKFNNDNQKYKFTPDYINAAFQYTWTFGDGTGSHDPVAIHRYREPGVYVACLTVWRGPECASTTCKEIRVQAQVNCDTAHVWYTYQRNTQIPNKIQFTANGTLPIIDQTWTITKMPGGPTVTLHQNNPLYLFQDTGYYRVCLRAVLLGGCVKEYCSYIRIEHVSNACELQAYPNPTSEIVNVNPYLPQPEMIHAYVYNSINVLVMDKHQQGFTGNNLVTLNVHNLVAGLYSIKLIYGNRTCYARFQKL